MDDEYVSPAVDNMIQVYEQTRRAHPPYSDGKLWIDLVDFRYMNDDEKCIENLEYQQIGLNANSSMAMHEAFADLPNRMLEIKSRTVLELYVFVYCLLMNFMSFSM